MSSFALAIAGFQVNEAVQNEAFSGHLWKTYTGLYVVGYLLAVLVLKFIYPLTKESLKEQGIQGIEITHFSELPFCAFKNIVWNKIRSCFDIAGIQPKIYSYSTYTPLGFQLCSQGFAACIMTQMHLANHLKEIPSDMNIFPIYSNGVHLPHQLAIATQKAAICRYI